MMIVKGLIAEIFNVGTSICASSINILCVCWWCWILMQERSSGAQNPEFFLFLWKRNHLVVKCLLCLAKSLLCVHEQSACAQIFQERPQIFQLCFCIIFQLEIFLLFFSPQHCCLLKASFEVADA